MILTVKKHDRQNRPFWGMSGRFGAVVGHTRVTDVGITLTPVSFLRLKQGFFHN